LKQRTPQQQEQKPRAKSPKERRLAAEQKTLAMYSSVVNDVEVFNLSIYVLSPLEKMVL
jgi:hypothetical protein